MNKLLILLIGIILAFGAACGGIKELQSNREPNQADKTREILKKYPPTVERVLRLSQSSATRKMTTPKGVTLWLEGNVFAEHWEMQAIDDGFDRAFVKARCAGMESAMFNHKMWTVALLSSVLSPIDKVPSFEMPYFGGVGSVEGNPDTITASGEFISLLDPGFNGASIIALADHEDNTMPDALRDSADYEMEHGALAAANADKYIDTRYHQQGGHPLLANCAQ